MRWLGVRDAINLDGGGSTTLVIRGAVANRPSDKSGERPIGDAIIILPPKP
jgi:exopolysaccharide biosynthesis protein